MDAEEYDYTITLARRVLREKSEALRKATDECDKAGMVLDALLWRRPS